ncbi:MAG: PQQ-binding-like beta-propeller repeat protein [Opitutaceae bacterium]|nr:PQQ-binding-like beta-propeller repeat protein [Opitutaceae bacterium]
MPPSIPSTRGSRVWLLLSACLPFGFEAAAPKPGHDWPAYLGEGAAHYSAAQQITTANVAQLTTAWVFRTGDTTPGVRSEIPCNPLIVDGVLYGTTSQLALFALDAATGRELWRFTPDRGNRGGPGGLARGLALWREGAERRLLFTAGPTLHAIDPATGKLIPTFGEQGRVDLRDDLDHDARGLYLAANAPGAIYRDLIILGMRVGEGPAAAAPGHIRAYDVRTGKRRWIFHTIPHPGEFGYETWSPDSWKTVGGANCWAGLVVDPERGLAFVPTGSAAFDFWGGDRLGDNLFANCLIALDAATGKRKWHFQFVHHDLWDYDLPAPPVLCEVTRAGKKIAAVAQVTKTGQVWVFDRETGESLFPWREEPVPPSLLNGEVAAKTQPIPAKPAPFARQRFTEDEVTNRTPAAREAVLRQLRDATPHQLYDPPSERGTVILPGFHGGAEWGGPAVDPRGVLYVNSSEMPWLLQMVPAAVLGADAKTLYTQLCASCHGANREGNAVASIPSLTTIAARLQPEEIGERLRTAKGMMPSFNFLPAASRDALVRFLISPETAAANESREVIPATAPAEGTKLASPYVTTGYNRFVDPDGYPALRPPWGTLNAIDLNTGDYLWKRPLGESPELTAPGESPTGTENYGGPVVTDGGVLFIAATKDEKFRAFSAATGEILWETRLPAAGYATPATYEVGGRQFVVIACGGGKLGTKSGDSYVAFALPPGVH